jgi:hypothetical protein
VELEQQHQLAMEHERGGTRAEQRHRRQKDHWREDHRGGAAIARDEEGSRWLVGGILARQPGIERRVELDRLGRIFDGCRTTFAVGEFLEKVRVVEEPHLTPSRRHDPKQGTGCATARAGALARSGVQVPAIGGPWPIWTVC